MPVRRCITSATEDWMRALTIPVMPVPSSFETVQCLIVSQCFRINLSAWVSSYMHSTAFSARHDEPDHLPTETMLKDLSNNITKNGDYPVARGGFKQIWQCTFHIDRILVKVAVKSLHMWANDDQVGPANTKKIKASVLLKD
ncbi:uncharacterized protein F5891DRAFT_979605 [Suillus fuscotomentosus]|uniref:Uncharacterized protein n=1 Tax=Suillus fuscotomentosus TaxID=1912939 RepID=A0AAD4E8D4_9AGAM|nr:uncharacterized protein F5891DRAFT_979605 [Suillus fuscotomentosus]KAG1901445.1 hypothetical protein F5891DRAFT_979605 [Suillus fuscotomentosus]